MIHHPDAESSRQQIPVDLAQPLVLEVHTPDGDLSVRAADRPDVLVNYDDAGDDDPDLTIVARGNHIEIRPRASFPSDAGEVPGDIELDSFVGQITKVFRFGGSFAAARAGKARAGFGSGGWPDVAIEIPRAMTARVEVHAASGNVDIEGVSGDITLNVMSGDLHTVHTEGNLTVQSASGDILVEAATGRFTAHTASGDIHVASAQLDAFQIQSVSGDVFVEAMLTGEGPFHAQTANGDVHLSLRRAAASGEAPAASLAYQTVSGDAHVSAPFRKTGRRQWRSGPDTGGPHIDVRTVSGDLTAEIAAAEPTSAPAPSPAIFAADAPPAPPQPPAPPAPPTGPRALTGADVAGAADLDATLPIASGKPDRLAVLAAVERGEIDVEEALRRLDAEEAGANP